MRDESQAGRHPSELFALDGRLLDILDGAHPQYRDEPLIHALRDLRERILESIRLRTLSDVWMRRFVRTVRSHLRATLWEAANRTRDAVSDVESCVKFGP